VKRLLVVLAAVALLLGVPGTGAHADPDGSGGSLNDQLAATSRAYSDAKARLDTATRRQAELKVQTARSEARLAQLNAQVGLLAATAYRAGPVGNFAAMLGSSSPDDFVARAMTLRQLAQNESRLLHQLKQAKQDAAAQQAALDKEITTARTQSAEAARRKAQIQQALDVAGGGPTTGVVIPAPSADPAPRNPDGSFPDENCSQKDPTTSGCLTPRTLHALQQARAAGFTHFTACWRQSSWGEHPKGRACDFAASPGGFGGVATGSDRDYGNRLAGYFIANADRLGVLYVIWYHQIWTPSVGWHYYTGDGTPSGDHMNHVHLSER
jgi:hypothetical protein